MKIAVVGCGAVAELRHLPALVRGGRCRVEALVDSRLDRAEAMARRFGIPRVFSDHRNLDFAGIEGAIVAVPNRLHAQVGVDLLESGLHVLVEKPMGMNAAECGRMIAAAERNRRVLAVGMMRRFLRSGRFARWACASGLIGRIHSFEIREGGVFDWPVASPLFFRREAAGGGVLIDTGAHTLDQLLWWLGDVDAFEYFDNSAGGVESDCEIHLRLRSGAEGIVELSRTRNLPNTAILRGERGELEVALGKNRLGLRFSGDSHCLAAEAFPGGAMEGPPQSQLDIIADEHEDWLEAIRTGRPPEVTGAEARERVALIESCYRNVRSLPLPWGEAEPETGVRAWNR